MVGMVATDFDASGEVNTAIFPAWKNPEFLQKGLYL
jgi:hypothetical protein